MRYVKHILFVMMMVLGSISSFAATPRNLADSGNIAYTKANYAKAITFYTEFINSGYESPDIYYNLGNCYYRTNDIAKAILNYEKAKKLAPQDGDIQFNLQIANQKTVDKITSDNQLFLVNWWNSFLNLASEKGWAIMCIVFLCICLTLIVFYLLSPRSIVKQFSFWGALFMIIFCLFSFILAREQYNIATTHDSAIVMAPTVTVKGAPTDTATQLFLIHEGAKVRIIKTNGNWVEVKLPNGNQGWMQASDIASI